MILFVLGALAGVIVTVAALALVVWTSAVRLRRIRGSSVTHRTRELIPTPPPVGVPHRNYRETMSND